MAASQAQREIRIASPLGEDVLLVRSFSVEEELGRLFEVELDLLSEDPKIDFDAIVGQSATLTVELPGGDQRFFNGYVNRFVQTGYDGRYTHYEATLVPWLWFLTRRVDCRIFQSTMPDPPSDMTAPNIVKKVFTDLGFNDFRFALNETYRKREYCVQYRESDFDFVSRLMEEEGLYYFFEHTDGKHTMVVVDSSSAHLTFPAYETIPYRAETKAAADRETITDWVIAKEVQSGAYALNDFDYLKPKKPLQAKSQIIAPHSGANFEVFDYPGDYLMKADGDVQARTRIEELHARHEVGHGQATASGICAGYLFSMEEYPREDQNREYLITAASHRFEIGEFESSGGVESGEFCTCTFTAIPSTVPFRSERLTARPSISGVQTAIVVGPSGDEIHTDEHARVKVQFHWDRYGKNDENSSCWVRVSHANAGKGWGSMITPRIGQEVIVEFLEGNPDYPIITGRVYNGDQKPPYAGGKGVISGLKSQTHKGSGYNEMSMDDTAGKEKVTIHGQYDMETTIEHDRTEKIGNDETVTIGKNRTENVGNDETITIAKNRTESVGVNETINIGSNRSITVGSSETATVALQRTHSVGINETITVGAAQEVSVGGTQAITVGLSQTTNVGKNRDAEVGADDSVKVGKNLVIDAGDSITIKTGSATITMKKDGTITIKGKDIKVDGSGKVNVKASSDVVIKGSKVGVN